MATQLIRHLQECAKNDEIYKPLESQWTFDERLIAKALQNVSVYFPHYSRHDESHSRQILVHIERLLGAENISKLTATDTWLLLEAAYLHDIGMIISDEHLKNDYDEIKKYVEKTKHLANGDTLIVMNALLASKEKTASSVFASIDISPFHAVKLLREIIADFYRTKHPERANSIILEPLDIGLNSPRNELLPRRFFGLLGKICAYHGASFEKVMELPKQQVGIGTDDCHPRFIACLLRLGDLLDLDDNRFCPVMMKMAGELPRISEAHHQKHLAIRHFRADPELIEIEADCPDYESYIETTKWFGWLREEVKNQMSRWFDIVPARHFGLLPSVGDLKAHLKDWQVFSEDKHPQFTLDRDRMFELLQGAGLYDGKEQAMRELLQNAVDATLIRIWREHGEDCKPQPNPFISSKSAPRDKDVLDILKKYPLDVKIEKEKENEEEQFNYWRITITDQGTGISRHDLEFLMSMGSSKKNYKKRAIIEKMPVWMKPSGIFGIGFHSVFLLTDEVIIETRSIDTGETLLIRLTSPTNEMEHGNVYFQIISEQKTIELPNSNRKEKSLTVSPWDFSRYGCQLSFIYKIDESDSLKYEFNDAIHRAILNYDGLVEPLENLHIIKFLNAVSKFFDHSFLNGKLKFEETTNELPNRKYTGKNCWHYSNKSELEILNILPSLSHSPVTFYYKGQEIKETPCSFPCLSIAVNLLNDKADELLTIDRNKFKRGVEKQKLFSRVSEAIQEFFRTNSGENLYNNFYEEYGEKLNTRIAAAYKLLDWELPNYIPNDEWEKIIINTATQDKTKIKDLKAHSVIVSWVSTHKDYASNTHLFKWFGKQHIRIPGSILSSDRIIYNLVCMFLKKEAFKVKYVKTSNAKDRCEFELVMFSKNIVSTISPRTLRFHCKEILLSQPNNNFFTDDFLKRRTIPILSSDYSTLELKNPNSLLSVEGDSYRYINKSFELDLISPRMLFPLARIGGDITVGDLDILAKRVYKNRANENATKEGIKKTYQKFIQMLDVLMKDEPEWVKLRGSEFS